ncbi:hypothetical protein [Nostoc sp.]|uniref:hypothetical protein n=1 Tax=Nostoc sp. TaxID=1180 RepID=UPI002FF792C8
MNSSTNIWFPSLVMQSALLMVNRSGTHTWGNGRFGLTLGAGVRLWCAIGWWGCRSHPHKAAN